MAAVCMLIAGVVGLIQLVIGAGFVAFTVYLKYKDTDSEEFEQVYQRYENSSGIVVAGKSSQH